MLQFYTKKSLELIYNYYLEKQAIKKKISSSNIEMNALLLIIILSWWDIFIVHILSCLVI